MITKDDVEQFCSDRDISVVCVFRYAYERWFEETRLSYIRAALDEYEAKDIVPFWVDQYIKWVSGRKNPRTFKRPHRV